AAPSASREPAAQVEESAWSCATLSEALRRRCYDFRSPRRNPRMAPSTAQPRIHPLEPPYAPAVEAGLQAMMPRSALVEPLRLFRTFVRAPAMADAMTALGRFVLGREFALDLHDREPVIHRVCARCRCEYEWGVHAAFFGPRAGLSATQL